MDKFKPFSGKSSVDSWLSSDFPICCQSSHFGLFYVKRLLLSSKQCHLTDKQEHAFPHQLPEHSHYAAYLLRVLPLTSCHGEHILCTRYKNKQCSKSKGQKEQLAKRKGKLQSSSEQSGSENSYLAASATSTNFLYMVTSQRGKQRRGRLTVLAVSWIVLISIAAGEGHNTISRIRRNEKEINNKHLNVNKSDQQLFCLRSERFIYWNIHHVRCKFVRNNNNHLLHILLYFTGFPKENLQQPQDLLLVAKLFVSTKRRALQLFLSMVIKFRYAQLMHLFFHFSPEGAISCSQFVSKPGRHSNLTYRCSLFHHAQLIFFFFLRTLTT